MSKDFEIANHCLVLKSQGKEVLTFNLNELLGFSNTLPWEIQNISITEINKKDNKIKISGFDSSGRIKAESLISLEGNKICLYVAFQNISEFIIKNSVMQIGINLENIKDENITIPHNIYNDNPGADPSRTVPHIGDKVGSGIIVEEHRLPIPAVNVEWQEEDKVKYVTLFSIPEPGDYEDDKYWSLGAVRTDTGIRIQSLSGQTMFNGIKDMVYAGKNAPILFERGYKNLLPKQRYEKNYCIDFGCNINKGRGFRNIVKSGYEIYKPRNIPAHSIEKVVYMKSNCLDSRYYCDEHSSGYLTFGAANSFGNKSRRPDYYLYGWTGQALKLAWCDIKLGLRNNEENRINKAINTVDFYVTNGESSIIDGMRYGYYLVNEKRWTGSGWDDFQHFSSRIQGEAVCDLLDIMLLLRKEGINIPKTWEEAIKRACIFIMDKVHQTDKGLYPLLWDINGIPMQQDINSSGISCVIALAKAFKFFNDKKYLDYAEQKLKLYYNYQMATFQYPFSRATMDARCEDKEAGMFFFLASFEMFKITKQEMYKEWTSVSADWILTFVYFWETGFKKGSYYDEKGFKTTGWPGVSVQNHHLDVFFPCYEVYHFGKLSENYFYEYMGKLVFKAFSHGICTEKGEWGFDVIGEQTEQFYQTNFFMSTYPELLSWVIEWRKGIRIWNPSWIIAQVLGSGIHFLEE